MALLREGIHVMVQEVFYGMRTIVAIVKITGFGGEKNFQKIAEFYGCPSPAMID
jgi:hypothetical protein